MANRFFARFWGRTDVYAKRVENKKTNKAGYYPQCINFWSDGCGKKWNAGFRCQDCHYQKYKVLTIDSIMSHLKGNEVIGVIHCIKIIRVAFWFLILIIMIKMQEMILRI